MQIDPGASASTLDEYDPPILLHGTERAAATRVGVAGSGSGVFAAAELDANGTLETAMRTARVRIIGLTYLVCNREVS